MPAFGFFTFPTLMRPIGLSLCVFFLAALVYGQSGFNGSTATGGDAAGERPHLTSLPSLLLIAFCVGLAALSGILLHLNRDAGLEAQRRIAARMEREFAPNGRIVSIGVPQLLVLLHRTNPNRYLFIGSGVDRHIHANTPGGFAGWLEELEDYRPEILAVSLPWNSPREDELFDWLAGRVPVVHIDDLNWHLFVGGGSR